MEIRKYKNKDFENFRKICIDTASENLRSSERKRRILTLTYCEYYVECEPDVCFALADGSDNAVGYIICAADNRKYAKAFSKYVRKIAKLSLPSAMGARFGAKIYEPFYNDYPAHLHIDILPEYQHSGYGTQLMNALKAELKSRNIKGVMLCVGAGNKNAVAFYNKNGFEIVKSAPGSYFMGCRLI